MGAFSRQVEPEIGIDLAAQVFGHLDRKAASADGNRSSGEGEFRVLDVAGHAERPAVRVRRDVAELHARRAQTSPFPAGR